MSSVCLRKMDPALLFNSYQDSKIGTARVFRKKNKELSVNITPFQLFSNRIIDHSKTQWLDTTIYYFSSLCGWNGLSSVVLLTHMSYTKAIRAATFSGKYGKSWDIQGGLLFSSARSIWPLTMQCLGLGFTAWQIVSQIEKQKMSVLLSPGFKSPRILFPLHSLGQSQSQKKVSFLLIRRMTKNLGPLLICYIFLKQCVNPYRYRFPGPISKYSDYLSGVGPEH